MDLDVHLDPSVAAVVDGRPISIATLRSSAKLTDYLSAIAEEIHRRRIVQAWGLQAVNARLDAILRLLTEGLCAPALFDLLGPPNVAAARLILIKAFTLFRMTEELYREPGTSPPPPPPPSPSPSPSLTVAASQSSTRWRRTTTAATSSSS
jgi:hypothetical protein